jgi:hypothetical protein
MDDTDKEAVAKLPVPEVSDELIRWLRAIHPQRVIGPDESLSEAHRRAGVQDLIDKLSFFNRLQAKMEQGDFEDDEERQATMTHLTWEAPTKEQEEHGFVLRFP